MLIKISASIQHYDIGSSIFCLLDYYRKFLYNAWIIGIIYVFNNYRDIYIYIYIQCLSIEFKFRLIKLTHIYLLN